jgi:hypothetical protein
VAPDGTTVYFAGKSEAPAAWQIYRARLDGGSPQAVTRAPGGAMNPAVLAGGDLLFTSPVPVRGNADAPGPVASLYAQGRTGAPRRLTFTPADATDPTVLADGRILFVTATPPTAGEAPARSALFTVNNDGTEFTAFAGQHDGGRPVLSRPRALGDGRVAFLAAARRSPGSPTAAEYVRTARPHHGRTPLLADADRPCRSVEAGEPGEWLACVETPGGSFGVYRLGADATPLAQPLFDDPAWDEVEAVRLVPRPEPQGHISAMTTTRTTGTLLCLDANESSLGSGPATPRAARIRLLAAAGDSLRALGELQPHPDGSFMVEAPADVPLALEALDETGAVVRRCPPWFWVRAGENRACVGCHEPHNRSPRNLRPLAANAPAIQLATPAPPPAPTPR